MTKYMFSFGPFLAVLISLYEGRTETTSFHRRAETPPQRTAVQLERAVYSGAFRPCIGFAGDIWYFQNRAEESNSSPF